MLQTRASLMFFEANFGATFAMLFAGLVFVSGNSYSAELSAAQSEADIRRSAQIVGMGSLFRPWTAHAVPNESLGLDLGLESVFVFRKNLMELGDQEAIAPRIVPVPRLWASWELPAEITASASFGPGAYFDGVSTWGLGAQWVFMRRPDISTNLSLVTHFSHVNVFNDLSFNASTTAIQVSRDLGIWQPYAGAGFTLARSRANVRIPAPGVETGPYWTPAAQLSFGARVDFLAKLSFQVDINQFKPSVSVLLTNRY